MNESEEEKIILIVDKVFKVSLTQKIIYVKESDFNLITAQQRKAMKKLQKHFKYIIQFELF